MPDWVSHILIGLIFAELFNIKKKGLVVLGSVMPDFIVKINLLTYFIYIDGRILFVTRLYHSPLMGLIIPALAAPLFRHDFKKTYLYIMCGFMLHIFADAFTNHFNDGILLYPLANKFISFNVFWPEEYWIILVGSIAVYGVIYFAKHFRRHHPI